MRETEMPPTPEALRISRIASLTLVNAMIFQQILSEGNKDVPPVMRTVSEPHVAEAFLDAWQFVLDQIDYIPIFQLARSVVRELAGTPDLDEALRHLARAAIRITSRRAALRHDLMGRIYHRLLADAKYFGAFYTTVPAATILLKLALDQGAVPLDWSSVESIRQLRIADLACGTGTLLKAALQTVVDNHVRARAEQQLLPDLPSVHRALVEDVLIGFDVIPFAIHLAASALAMHEPNVPFGDMHLYTLPLGSGDPIRLGSLELLLSRVIEVQADLLGGVTGPERMTASGQVPVRMEVPELDVCVMNPPFTRSVGGNLLFGNAPRSRRRRMQARLREIVRQRDVPANITAGLGSVFTAIGHSLVKPGGHLALVLPRALLSGVAWQRTRLLIGGNYHVRFIIVSHQPGRWNFSENTDLSECLIVAKRLVRGEAAGPTKVVNLWRQPTTSVEGLTVAELAKRTAGVYLDGATGVDEIRTEAQKIGEVILCPPERIAAGEWSMETAFAQTELCRVAHYLSQGEIYIPGEGVVGRVPLIRLQELGSLGPDARDIHDGFRLAGSTTRYAAFWGHGTVSVRSIAQAPNRYLSPLARARRGRHLRDPVLLWSRAGRLMLAERMRLGTLRVTSVRLDQRALSNTWWPIAISDEHGIAADDIECVLSMWFNSTFGVISLIAARVETEGPWMKFKKPILENLRVIDPLSLSARARRVLLDAYGWLSRKTFQPLPEINGDGVREQIDAVIARALQLREDVGSIRALMAVEPLIVGART
jgi:hypothetical protein